MSTGTPMPGAAEGRTRLIVGWHASGHSRLDEFGIPRMRDGLEYTIGERIALLAEKGGVEKLPPADPRITGPHNPVR